MKPPNWPKDPNALIVAVGPGGRTGKYLQVRINQQAVVELHEAMQAEDVYAGASIQASYGVSELAALMASFAGGLGGLAAVLRTILHRHQHRAFLIERDGTTFELKGMSAEEMDARIDEVLKKAAQDQADTEHLYRGIPGADDDLDH